jgi:hypothetical protein
MPLGGKKDCTPYCYCNNVPTFSPTTALQYGRVFDSELKLMHKTSERNRQLLVQFLQKNDPDRIKEVDTILRRDSVEDIAAACYQRYGA